MTTGSRVYMVQSLLHRALDGEEYLEYASLAELADSEGTPPGDLHKNMLSNAWLAARALRVRRRDELRKDNCQTVQLKGPATEKGPVTWPCQAAATIHPYRS